MKHSLAYIKAINVFSSDETEDFKLKISQSYPECDFRGKAYDDLKGTPIENLRSLRLENPVINSLANLSKALLVSNIDLNEYELKNFFNVHVKGVTIEEIDKAATRAIAYVED